MNIDEFVSHIAHEKRYSQHTVKAYRKDLEQFNFFVSTQYSIIQPSQIKPAFVRSWLVSLMDEGVTARSVNRKVSSLKSYFKYLIRHQIISSNPMDKVLSPKVAKKLPVFVDKKNMNQFFNYFVFTEDYDGKLDRTILEMFYSTGIRLSELINLKSQDVDLLKKQIKVTGKRNKQRIIPIGMELLHCLEQYIHSKIAEGIGSSNFFVNKKGNKLYPKFVYRKVNHYLSMVSTIDKKSPHVLRHTFATHMLNNGADLNAIKELLGHASLAATQVYTHNTIDKLKAVYNQAHPKA